MSTENLNYEVACKVQSKEVMPKNVQNPTTPNLCIRIAYASKLHNKEYQRLLKGNSASIIKLDYSFNEFNFNTSIMKINNESSIRVYSLVDLIAEKFRAILQQISRNRARRQDIYDLNYLIINYINNSEYGFKKEILNSLKLKSESRKIQLNKYSLRNPEIIERSKKEYSTLKDEIEGNLPIFEDAYFTLREFYESLPWDK
jgi:predicted nucleotidyltransferase component of viral defense system